MDENEDYLSQNEEINRRTESDREPARQPDLESATCIDLTEHDTPPRTPIRIDPNREPDAIIDLTANTPVVIKERDTGANERRPTARKTLRDLRTKRKADRDRPYQLPAAHEKLPEPETQPSSSSAPVSCPICWDDLNEISSSGRHLMSTGCGHVFCDRCIQGVLNEKRGGAKCPKCRVRIFKKSTRPLYL